MNFLFLLPLFLVACCLSINEKPADSELAGKYHRVKKGDTLLILDNREFKIKLDQSLAAEEAAKTGLNSAKAATDAARANINTAKASIGTIDAQIEAAKIMEWDDEAVLLLRNVDDGTMFFRSVVG